MSIMLGNVSLNEIEKRCGIKIPETLRTKLINSHQDDADVTNNKWHCFDLPFCIVCGGEDLFNDIKNTLLPFAEDFKEELGITYRTIKDK